MRRAACLLLLTCALSACDQRGSADARIADADAQERARQEKAAKEMVAQTEDQVRVKMLEQRLSALEAQVAAMQADRKLLDAHLVEQRLAQIEAARIETGGDTPIKPAATPTPAAAQGKGRSPSPAPTPSTRKPLVLDLR
ncbi:hypothetical protein [Sphingomonas sanguinis]|uniref:Lipoprotein n=1 Tax=Sphingomonas sanguinis TaxID=33051 RepID=A0A147IJL1_9SPHN|nr:hypothetical protein [Sphingomonas sanguinis]KTT93775.1 hypothetical protein SB4_17840 [Sphingomonas sanguinis]